LLLGAVERQTVIVGLDVADRYADVFAAHTEERADIKYNDIDGTVLIEDEIP
jgi:hypothetical protein